MPEHSMAEFKSVVRQILQGSASAVDTVMCSMFSSGR